MTSEQREPNPDVNTFNIGEDSGTTEQEEIEHDQNPGVEEKHDTDVIPVPPDAERKVPIEEPPGSSGPPMGE